jgi:hypothetical protein
VTEIVLLTAIRDPRRLDRMDDDVSVDELREAVEHMHGVKATFLKAEEVDERFEGAPVWTGSVKVFTLDHHPSGAALAFAWSIRLEGTKRRFIAILGVPPVTSPTMAVRAYIMAETKKAQS